MTKRHRKWWLGFLCLGACLALAPPVARAGTPSPAAPAEQKGHESRPRPDASIPVDGNFHKPSYAEREAQQPQTADFKGGESVSVYIGGSAVAIVLFVVLLVVLL
jgi:hypothetical protein